MTCLRLLGRGVALGLVLAAAPPTLGVSTFTGVGDLPATLNDFLSRAYAVSPDGSVVVGESAANQNQAFYWTAATGIKPLLPPPNGTADSQAYAVADHGIVVVGNDRLLGGSDYSAVRWTSLTGAADALRNQTADVVHGSAVSVTPNGQIIAGAFGAVVNGTFRPIVGYRWTAATGQVPLPFIPGWTDSGPQDISADGNTIVGFADDGSTGSTIEQAFIWTAAGGMRLLPLGPGPHPNPHSVAFAVSPDGRIVGGAVGSEAALWVNESNPTLLGFLDPTQPISGVSGLSADGSVVIGNARIGSGINAPFLWDPSHGMRPLSTVLTQDYGLKLTGWRLDAATGISDDGRTIVGYGLDPAGHVEGFVAHLEPAPTPEPGVWMLCTFGSAALALMATRRRSGGRVGAA